MVINIPIKRQLIKDAIWNFEVTFDDIIFYESKFNFNDKKTFLYRVIDLFLNQYGPYNDQQVYKKIPPITFTLDKNGKYLIRMYTNSKVGGYNEYIILDIYKD